MHIINFLVHQGLAGLYASLSANIELAPALANAQANASKQTPQLSPRAALSALCLPAIDSGKSLAEIYANSLASLAKFEAFRLFGLSDAKGFVVSLASHGELTSSVKTRSSSNFSIFSSYIFHIYAE